MNHEPKIIGNPPSAVLFGEMYDFRPDVTDPDGDALSFSIFNKPHWAQFDEANGRLFGQPTQANVGTYDNVEIRVTDDKAVVSLRAFSITVSQTSLGSVTLDWRPPADNTDGSPLLDLAGYKIYYGRASQAYDHEIHVSNPGVTRLVVENLVSGTYFFAATAVNRSGMESALSSEAERTVDF